MILKFFLFLFIIFFLCKFILLVNTKIFLKNKKYIDKCIIFDYFLINPFNKVNKVKKAKKFKTAKKAKKDYNYYKNLPPEKYETELKIWYKKKKGKKLDLNNPKTLNEKIQWLKLYDSTPIKTLLADKYLIKKYIKDIIGKKYVIPILKVWDSYNQINFNSLPNKFVLKANHGSGMNIIIHNKNTVNIKKIKQIAKKWMNINYAFKHGFELHYMNIKPKIFAEKYYDNMEGDLFDYKLYCFDGRVESIAFLSGKKKFRRIAFYDPQWKRLNYRDTYPAFKKEIPKPNKLNEMIEISKKLSKGFAFVRIDLYILNDGDIKFGEMTFTPDSGQLDFYPSKQNLIFGQMIKLPKKSPIPKKII